MSIPGRRELARWDPPRGQVEALDQAVIVHDVLLVAGRGRLLLVPPCAARDGLAPARPGAAMADEASSPAASRRHPVRQARLHVPGHRRPGLDTDLWL